MKNSEQPIHSIVNSEGYCSSKDKIGSKDLIGLTKREYFAAMAMQGLLSLPTKGEFNSVEQGIEAMVSFAVASADELLKQLEK